MLIHVKGFNGSNFEIIHKFDLSLKALSVKTEFCEREAVPVHLQRLIVGGRYVPDDHVLPEGSTVYVCLSLPGGKGGFGSMLRAIGAQIEKTTNREACRDLSGRRLRDINEEKRLKEWISKQADREQDSQKKRIQKLERMRAKPKHEFHDPDYDRQRSQLPEEVDNSVQEGLKKDLSAGKRKPGPQKGPAKKKTIWLGIEDLESDSSDSEDSENLEKNPAVEANEVANPEKESSEKNSAVSKKSLDLASFVSLDQLLALGEEVLAQSLGERGAKTGGTLQQRAERLWAFRGKNTLKKLHPPLSNLSR